MSFAGNSNLHQTFIPDPVVEQVSQAQLHLQLVAPPANFNYILFILGSYDSEFYENIY
jgi:hypothetical protein